MAIEQGAYQSLVAFTPSLCATGSLCALFQFTNSLAASPLFPHVSILQGASRQVFSYVGQVSLVQLELLSMPS